MTPKSSPTYSMTPRTWIQSHQPKVKYLKPSTYSDNPFGPDKFLQRYGFSNELCNNSDTANISSDKGKFQNYTFDLRRKESNHSPDKSSRFCRTWKKWPSARFWLRPAQYLPESTSRGDTWGPDERQTIADRSCRLRSQRDPISCCKTERDYIPPRRSLCK